MLKSIDYTVTFGTTGRTLAEQVNFQKGFGTITGPNEAGKSFVVEMVRWCLFGVGALRGKASEYKKAKATLTFDLKGVDYQIERTTTGAKLLRGKDLVASGTTPVNTKVASLLGFGLEVFDVSCVANQGDIEKLGAMKPTERKRMVDSVIGLGVIEDLQKWAGDEANALKRQASDLAAMLREPTPPEQPAGYQPEAELQAAVSEALAAKMRLAELRPQIKTLKAPEDPTPVSVELLEELSKTQEDLKAELTKARMDLKVLPDASAYSSTQLDDIERAHEHYRQWLEKKALLAKSAPSYTDDQLHKMADQWDAWDLWSSLEELRKSKDKLLAQGFHHCPACSHEWPVADGTKLRDLEDKIAALGELTPVDRAPLSRVLIEGELEYNRMYAAEIAPKLLALQDVMEVPAPALSLADVENHRRRNEYAGQRAELQAMVEKLDRKLAGQPDYRAMLAAKRAFEEAMKTHVAEVFRQSELAQEVQKLTPAAAQYEPLLEVLQAVRLYHSLQDRYAADMEAYLDGMTTVQGLTEQAEDWAKAKIALTNLRSMVKQHLVPSLNKVASHYLQQMTGGQRQQILVDEEFNILVDGQDLNTLSGSGKAVANLSLRLGLGQVLTNNVMSLFIGDEIDASMDKDRAENTAQTLQTLKNRISQILLVTHKFPSADYYISVGNKNDFQAYGT